jgi:hypothetical protein
VLPCVCDCGHSSCVVAIGDALQFFFGRAFFQGRNDAVSQKVDDAAIAVLASPSLAQCVELARWVRRFAIKIDIAEQGASDRQVQVAILELSRTYGCSPLHLNQGIWYAGSKAYDLLLECLVGPLRSGPSCQDWTRTTG